MFLADLFQLSDLVSKEVAAEYTLLMFLSFYCVFMIHCHRFCCGAAFFLSALTKDRKAPWALSFFYILSNKARQVGFFRCFMCMAFINVSETL